MEKKSELSGKIRQIHPLLQKNNNLITLDGKHQEEEEDEKQDQN